MSEDSVQVGVGTLLPGATKVEAGVCDTWLGTVRLSTGRDARAFVKLLPPRQILSELVASLLAHYSELPAPLPLLVKVYRTTLPLSSSWQENEVERLAFGSEDVAQPSFSRFTNQSQTVIAKLLNWEYLNRTGAFDEWIANGDRHSGNLLFDGNSGFWLIDHSHAFTGAEWTAVALVANVSIQNQLIDVFAPKGEGPAARAWLEETKGSCRDFAQLSIAELPQRVMAETYVSELDARSITSFLRDRLKHVVPMVSAKLGIPELPL
jgi:hypothetical protein